MARRWHRGTSTSLREDGQALVEQAGPHNFVALANRGSQAGALLTEERFASFSLAEQWVDANLPPGPITYSVRGQR